LTTSVSGRAATKRASASAVSTGANHGNGHAVAGEALFHGELVGGQRRGLLADAGKAECRRDGGDAAGHIDADGEDTVKRADRLVIMERGGARRIDVIGRCDEGVIREAHARRIRVHIAYDDVKPARLGLADAMHRLERAADEEDRLLHQK
jgi:hypothetical protein